jgi:hypothetical protein
MEQEQNRIEIQEAIDAADRALRSLERARDSLHSAKGWGVFDMLGGGLFSTWVKHSNMNEAEESLADVQAALREFSRELDDVDETIDLSFNNADLLTFADYFMDGLFTDFLMQGRINDAIGNVDNTINQVTAIRNALQQKLL